MSTRNLCVARGALTGRPVGIAYEVEPGHVLVLKSVVLAVTSSADQTLEIQLYSSDQGVGVTLYSAIASTTKPFAWSGWTVLNPADTVRISYSAGPVFYWIAGALLPEPTPVP